MEKVINLTCHVEVSVGEITELAQMVIHCVPIFHQISEHEKELLS